MRIKITTFFVNTTRNGLKKPPIFLLTLLFSFLSISQILYMFTSCGVTGKSVPTETQVTTAYTVTKLDGNVTIKTQGIQEWTVPSTGIYRINAAGDQGICSGGLGADLTGTNQI